MVTWDILSLSAPHSKQDVCNITISICDTAVERAEAHFCLFKKWALSSYSTAGAVPGTWDVSVNKLPPNCPPPKPYPLGAYLVSGTQLFPLAAMYLWASYKVFLRLSFLLLTWNFQAHLCSWVDLRDKMKYRTQWPGSVPSPLLSGFCPSLPSQDQHCCT